MKPNHPRLPALRHAALGALAVAALLVTGAARADSSVTVKLVGPDGPGATIGHTLSSLSI